MANTLFKDPSDIIKSHEENRRLDIALVRRVSPELMASNSPARASGVSWSLPGHFGSSPLPQRCLPMRFLCQPVLGVKARRAVWKVGLAVCARNLETRESRSASKISIGDSTCLLGFSACIFARLSSSIFKAETRTCRTKQILSFLIWKEGNGGQLGGLKGATDFFFFFYFNWRLITLQYCGSFCHTFTWISQGCTCVPHPEPPSHLPSHPIPVHQAWAPCLMHLTWTDFLLREMRE